MAGVIGGAGGYATVGPTRNYIGEAMSNVQDSMFRQNAQRMANEKALQEQQQAVKEAQDKKDKEAIDYAEKHKLTKTGVRSIDTKNYEFALKMQQLNVEGVDELSRARTIEEKTAAMSKIQKAISGFDSVNKFNNDYNANKEDVLKNQDKYDPNYLVDMAEEGKKFENGQWEYNIDENYNVGFSTHDIDPDTGKVSAVTAQNLSGGEMAAKFKGLPKSNYAGEGDGVSFLDNFSKRIKDKKEETKVNGRIITNYPTAVADAESAAKAAISDPSLRFNVKTQIAKSLNINKGEVTDEQVYQKILTDVKSLIPTEKNEVDKDERAYNFSVKKEANDQRNSDRTYKKDVAGKKTVKTSPLTNRITGAIEKDKNGKPIMVTSTSVTTDLSQAEAKKEKQPAKVVEKRKYHNIQTTNKGSIGLNDETWYNIKTGTELKDNQVIFKEKIKEKAKASGYSEKEYSDLLIKKGIYIIQ